MALGVGCTRAPRPETQQYTDPELGFSLTLSPGWSVDAQAQAAWRAFQARTAAGDGGTFAAPQGAPRQLVSIYQRGDGGRSLGRLSVFVSRGTAAEFLAGYLSSLEGGSAPRIHEEHKGYDVGGRPYDLARVAVDLGGLEVEQELYATQVGSEAVLFALTAADRGSLAGLKAMMWSVRWPAGR